MRMLGSPLLDDSDLDMGAVGEISDLAMHLPSDPEVLNDWREPPILDSVGAPECGKSGETEAAPEGNGTVQPYEFLDYRS